jgi:hypothetical protein
LTFLLLLLVILFPIAGYCVLLALLNRRVQPAMVLGTWDFLALLSAFAGLLLFGGPELIRLFFHKAEQAAIFSERGPSQAAADNLYFWRWVAYGTYFAIVVGGGALLVWLRRSRTVIYNVAPEDLARALDQAFAGLRLDVTRAGNRLYVGFGNGRVPQLEPVAEPYLAAVSAAPLSPVADAAAVSARAASGEAVVDVEPFAALSNVTLHWRSDSGTVRREVEEELARSLKDVRTYDNSAGTWFLGVAGFLFAMIFMVVLALILAPFIRPGR